MKLTRQQVSACRRERNASTTLSVPCLSMHLMSENDARILEEKAASHEWAVADYGSGFFIFLGGEDVRETLPYYREAGISEEFLHVMFALGFYGEFTWVRFDGPDYGTNTLEGFHVFDW